MMKITDDWFKKWWRLLIIELTNSEDKLQIREKLRRKQNRDEKTLLKKLFEFCFNQNSIFK